MTHFLQTTLGGVMAGSIYALVAVGVALIFKVSRVLNLAQGEFLIFGALLAYSIVAFEAPLWLACILAVLAVAASGLVFERLAIRPMRGRPMIVVLVVTLGTSMLMRGAAMVLWGKDPMSLPSFSGDAPILVWGLAISPQGLWIVAGIGAIAAALWLFLERTLLGKALLAAAENPSAAQMVGINVNATSRLAVALSAGVGAVAGVLVAPVAFITYDGGTMIGLKAFIAATLGGMGSLLGAVAGGLFIGLLEAWAAGYVSSLFKDTTAFVVLIFVLVLRSGLDKRASLTHSG